MSAITRSGSAIVSVVTKWCPTRRTSSLPRKKRSTPTSRIVATAGEATIPPGLLQTRASVYQTSHTRYTPSARHALVTTGAAAWYQAGRGNAVGCARQLEKAARRLGPYAPAHRGVNVDGLLAQVAAATVRVQDGSLDLEPVDP